MIAQAALHGLPSDEIRLIEGLLDPHALTIGLAGRFTMHQRPLLVLSDLARLRQLVLNGDRPVQIIFAGKAHPADREGQELIRRLFVQTEGDFRGRVVLLEDYDIEIGRMLVQGCDVWLNTPRHPQEVSGTSGQKAAVNGGVNVSVLDGWWVDGYRGDNGWAIGDGTVGPDAETADRRDAIALYDALQQAIVPRFFERGANSLPNRWIETMKASIESIVPRFSAHRMLRDYAHLVYCPDDPA
jgi:starch phosphorylase